MNAPIRSALEHIIAGAEFECERHTTGIGACYRQGMTPDAKFWSDRCCSACISFAALCEADAMLIAGPDASLEQVMDAVADMHTAAA